MINQQGQVVFLSPIPDANNIDSLCPGECDCELEYVINKNISVILKISLKTDPDEAIGPHWLWFNIVSGKGLVPLANNALSEPV